MISTIFAQTIKNCNDGGDCLTNLPEVNADSTSVGALLGIVFGVIGAVAVVIIIVQGIRFILSGGDPQKATDARKGVIYAAVGLGVAVSAEIIVQLVVGRI